MESTLPTMQGVGATHSARTTGARVVVVVDAITGAMVVVVVVAGGVTAMASDASEMTGPMQPVCDEVAVTAAIVMVTFSLAAVVVTERVDAVGEAYDIPVSAPVERASLVSARLKVYELATLPPTRPLADKVTVLGLGIVTLWVIVAPLVPKLSALAGSPSDGNPPAH